MKTIIAISICITVLTLLLIPRYDLYVLQDNFTDSYTIVEKGFFLEEHCIEKGKLLHKSYKCTGYSTWEEFLKKSYDYNNEREIE